MKFGKLDNKELLSTIDWNLPVKRILHHTPDSQSAKLYIGSTGWGEKSWIGKLYPPKTKTNDYLKFYSQHFNSVELNTTHYREPELDIIQKWRSQVGPDFKFAPKVYQLISHYGGMNNSNVVRQFLDKCRYFEENLGVIFLQVSDSFAYNRLSQLEKFINTVTPDLKIAIEVRHESWFPLHQEFLDLISSRNISLVVDDIAGRRDILHLDLTANHLMIRFVGNALHETDYTRLQNWFNTINEVKKDLDEIYFFIHQPDGVMVPETLEYINQKYLLT